SFLFTYSQTLRRARGLEEQHRQQPDSKRAFLAHLKACIEDRLTGVAIPVAVAGEAGCQGRDKVLQERGKAALRAHVFEQQERSVRLEDAPDLLETTQRVTDGAEDQGCDDAIERAVLKGQGLRARLRQIERHARLRLPPARVG